MNLNMLMNMSLSLSLSIVTILKCYLSINLLIALTSVTLWLVDRYLKDRLSYAALLKITYGMILASMLFPPFLANFAAPKQWMPRAQVWSELQPGVFKKKTEGAAPHVAVAIGPTTAAIPLKVVTYGVVGILALGFLLTGSRVLKDAWRIKKIVRESVAHKRYMGVTILINDALTVPFSVWWPFRAYVILPKNLLTKPDHYQIVVKHELQHHRQSDTKCVYILQLMKAACFWNPFAFKLQQQLEWVQEVACDEYLIGHQKISSSAYCDCLLWVAQNTLQSRKHLVGTAGFVSGSAAKILQGRIEQMFSIKTKNRISRFSMIGLSIVATGVLAAAALAANASIQDRRISMADAQRMADAAQGSEFPVGVNELVLEQLNLFLGTPEGRERIRRGLVEMKFYEGGIKSALDRSQMPHELLAVPLIESGYRNLPHDGNPRHGAGIWMFIASTARTFGLRVDDQVDERLIVSRETGAAIAFLSSLHQEFNDWGLAVMAYNAGEEKVRKGIEHTGSRDVWALIRAGYENDAKYVASVIAAVLILKNPDSLE